MRHEESPSQSHEMAETTRTLTEMAGSLSIFITPRCYKIKTMPPRGRGGPGLLHTEPRKGPQSGLSFFKPSQATTDRRPSSSPMRALFETVADIVNQQFAAFLPAHTLSCHLRVPALRVLLSRPPSPFLALSLFPFLTCLRFPAKPSQMCYQIRGKNPPCPKFTSVGIPFFSVSFRSRPVDLPYVCFWLCLYIYETTPFNGTDARAKVPSASSLTRSCFPPW